MTRSLHHSEKKHNLYLDLAVRISKESYCKRLQVGALIVKDGNIISFGYNGTPSGLPNVCEEKNVTLPTVLHAESNAITKACKSPISTEGATIYMTHSCCVECAKLIVQSGIKKVYYIKEYRDLNGIKLLQDCDIDVSRTNIIKPI
ncbi:dCMP deaminase family protein [Arenimonas sp.]|jgi:dCMP deaminase|uniref:dCMP deaminase family protein n=1 Tax=Arenimonas sp. TaxID=1872635 RepID=UPI0037C0E580